MLPSGFDNMKLWISWLNENDLPYYTPVTLQQNGEIHADVPPGLYGMTFAALVNSKDMKSLNTATLAGPLPIPLGPGDWE
jgi:hypothetical protein